MFQQSIFFATQAATVLHWSRISDHVGRKPVIMTGLAGLSLSMYCFGLSRTFWGAVVRFETFLTNAARCHVLTSFCSSLVEASMAR